MLRGGKANLGSCGVPRWEENLPEETVLGLTLQHAEVGVQGFHLTCDDGTQLAIKGIKEKQAGYHITPLFMGPDPADKGLLVRRHSPFGHQDFLLN